MSARRWARAVAVAALAGPVGLGIAVASAVPAAADNSPSSITCPGASGGAANGTRVTTSGQACAGPVTGTASDGSVAVSAAISCNNPLGLGCSTSTFTVTLPSGDTTDTPLTAQSGGSGKTLTITVPKSYANGKYTASLSGNGASASATFVLDVPPSSPGTPTLGLSTPGQATVTWAVSAPTSASSYALTVDGSPTTLTPDCSAVSTCTGTVTGLSGGSHAFAVTGSRSDGNGGILTSQAASASGTVTAVPASSTSPSSSPTSGSSSGSGGSTTTAGGSTGTVATGGGKTGTTGTTKSGTTGTTKSGATSSASAAASQIAAAAAAQRRAESFQSFAPSAGIAQLPPLPKFPAAAAPDDGDGEPTSQGTYVPTLPYNGQQTVTEKISKPTLLGHVTDAVSDRELLESICGAALVLLIAAHLRVLARRDPAADL